MDYSKVDTWFFETLDYQHPDILSVKLVEGIKSEESEYILEDTDAPLGPYFPVRVEKSSRCVRIIFSDVLAFQVVEESLASPQASLDDKEQIGPVIKCTNTDYLRYLELDSNLTETHKGKYSSYFIWTEDQTILVVACSDPEVLASDELPNLELERCATYFSN